MSDWIEWAGGECPVSADTVVRVKFSPMRSESAPYESVDGQRAGALWWDHRINRGEPSAGNIIAYRIIKEPAA